MQNNIESTAWSEKPKLWKRLLPPAKLALETLRPSLFAPTSFQMTSALRAQFISYQSSVNLVRSWTFGLYNYIIPYHANSSQEWLLQTCHMVHTIKTTNSSCSAIAIDWACDVSLTLMYSSSCKAIAVNLLPLRSKGPGNQTEGPFTVVFSPVSWSYRESKQASYWHSVAPLPVVSLLWNLDDLQHKKLRKQPVLHNQVLSAAEADCISLLGFLMWPWEPHAGAFDDSAFPRHHIFDEYIFRVAKTFDCLLESASKKIR